MSSITRRQFVAGAAGVVAVPALVPSGPAPEPPDHEYEAGRQFQNHVVALYRMFEARCGTAPTRAGMQRRHWALLRPHVAIVPGAASRLFYLREVDVGEWKGRDLGPLALELWPDCNYESYYELGARMPHDFADAGGRAFLEGSFVSLRQEIWIRRLDHIEVEARL